MSRTLAPFVFVVAVAPLTACATDDLAPGSFLDRDRVIGARVEVTGDPSRASPMPGEQAVVRWLVAGPTAPSPHAWTLGACAGTSRGCTDEPAQVERGESAEPTLLVTAPAADVLWIGGEIDASRVVASVPIARDGLADANRNPSLAEVAITLGGAGWPATADADTGDCASLPVLRAADGEIVLTIDLASVTRERYPATAPDGSAQARREPLQVSHFTSVGALDRQYSVIESDDDTTTIEVAWIAPGDGVDAARVARFVFVVRDGRGGLDVATRAACVVP